MRKILITGGAGYIGSVLTRQLVSDPANKVIVYDNLLYKQNSLVDLCFYPNFEFVYGDVRDTEKLLSYVNQADHIFPLAAIVGAPACDKDPNAAFAVNHTQILTIGKHLSKDQSLVFTNTNSGYGIGEVGQFCTEQSPLNPISRYGIAKVTAESYLLSSRKGISLRLATVFGTSSRMRLDLLVNDFTYKAVTEGHVLLFERHFKRNYIHIKDVVNVLMNMMYRHDYKGEAFNVGLSSANLSKQELCEKIKEYVPGFIINHNEYKKDPDQRNYIVSNEKLENIGWRPVYSLDNGIKELIKAYKIIVPGNQPFTNL